MKTSIQHFLTPMVAAALLTLGSCSIYHPQTVDIPLINHAGDTRVDVAAGVSTWLLPDVVTFGGTVSYGVTDWLALQGHVNYGGDNIYVQAAPGAYLPLSEHSVLEGYVGYGYGSSWRETNESDTSGTGTYSYSGHFTLPFGQVNIGWRDLSRAHIDLALGLKGGAYLPDYQYNRFDADGVLMADRCSHYNTPNMLIEPQLLFRIGGERVKYCLRISMAFLSDINKNGGEHFTADFLTISNGLTFSF